MTKDLEAFFNPLSIAVIGASRSEGKLGHAILESLKVTFPGKLYPINPNSTEIMGLTCYPSVLNVEEPIDLAVIVVPAQIVKESVADCIKKKIKAAVIISSGFSEIGQKDRELELKKMCKDKMRLIGPNCIGIYKKNLDMLFLPRKRLKRPPDGSISFITQSGAFGAALLDMIADEGVGISKFISIGNKIDVEEVELLKYLDNDLETRCIALYIESIENGLELIETAKKIVKKKPIVVFKAGKTSKGAEAVASHTGKLATKAEVYSAVFKQAGMIEAHTTEELFDFAKSLASQPILGGNKIAIVTDGGGFGIVAADQAVQSGFELPELSKEALKVIKNALPSYGIAKNPIDLTGDSNAERYEKVLGAVFKDQNINGVVVIALLQIPTLEETITDVLRDCKIHGKPFTVCSPGGQWAKERTRIMERFGVPIYPTPERTVKSLAVLKEYSEILKRK